MSAAKFLFKPYQGKPVVRMAFQIKEGMNIEKGDTEALYVYNHEIYRAGSTVFSEQVPFKAYEEPKVGDWIVRLTDSDTYHCTDAVFRERNVVHD